MISAIEANRKLSKIIDEKVDIILNEIEDKINEAIYEQNSNNIIFTLDTEIKKLILDGVYIRLIDERYHVLLQNGSELLKPYLEISWKIN